MEVYGSNEKDFIKIYLNKKKLFYLKVFIFKQILKKKKFLQIYEKNY